MGRRIFAQEDAQNFVDALKAFKNQLAPEQQGMLERILDAAQQNETAGYGRRIYRSDSDSPADQDETAGYGRRIQHSETDLSADQDETAGYGRRLPRSEDEDDERWEGLAEWLSKEDETSGYQAKYKF